MNKKKIAREKFVSAHRLTLFILLIMTTIVKENIENKESKKKKKTYDVKV